MSASELIDGRGRGGGDLNAQLRSVEALMRAGLRDTARSAYEEARRLAPTLPPADAVLGPIVARLPRNRQIVLVAENPKARLAKIAYGLRSAGCDVVVLHKNPFQADDTGAFFTEARRYHSVDEALAIAREYRPLAFHVFSDNVDQTLASFIDARPGKIVMDAYDTLDGIQRDWGLRHRHAQHYCVERADALCARDLRFRWVARTRGCRIPRAILFMDYCWNRPEMVPSPARKISDTQVHIAAAGYILVEKKGETEQMYLRVARELARHGVHFHIYPHHVQAPTMDQDFSEYVALGREVGTVHVHAPVGFDRLPAELSQYHAGVAFNGAQVYGEPPRDYDVGYLQNATAARVFDYAEAGLPILDNRSCFTFRFRVMSRLGMAIDVTPELLANAGTALRPLLAPEMQDRARRLRDVYSIRRQIGRLIRFYESL